jgi:hypothetical protein
MGIARLRDVPWSALAMPHIEHLRKQAKLYLRWHRQQYYPVAARIRAVLPRYSGLIDREILRQPFRLSDAQELVARTVGCGPGCAAKYDRTAARDVGSSASATRDPCGSTVERTTVRL